MEHFYEFSELVKNTYRIGKYKSCGRYFLIITKRNMEYCKNKNTNGQTCAQNAAKARFKESMWDVYLNKYDKKLTTVYQNYYREKDLEESELTGSEFTHAEYADWRDKAVQLRKEYISERDRISKDYTLIPQKKHRDKQKLGEKFLTDLYAISPVSPGTKGTRHKNKGEGQDVGLIILLTNVSKCGKFCEVLARVGYYPYPRFCVVKFPCKTMLNLSKKGVWSLSESLFY